MLAIIMLGCSRDTGLATTTANQHVDELEKAVESLLKSDSFIFDGYSGIGYQLKNPAHASIIAILESETPAATFNRVLETGTPAAKLYALCGLYFCSQHHFNEALDRVRKTPIVGDVYTVDGDIAFTRPAMEIVTSTSNPAVRLLYGESLPDFIARTGKFGVQDISGGGLPVRLLDESWIEFRNAQDFPENSAEVSEFRVSYIQSKNKFYARWATALSKSQK